MNAGGLAQMTLPNHPPAGALAVPGSGFASRGKGAHIKRLSTSNTDPGDGGAAAPRTSRSHLLAGLRTAPRTPTVAAPPPSAPPTRVHHDDGRADHLRVMPQTAVAAAFPAHFSTGRSLNPMNANRQIYSLPEQVLAPPAIDLVPGQEQMDPNLYAELVATNLYLAQQQQRLQQQLIHVTAAAAQQFQGLHLYGTTNGGAGERHPWASPDASAFHGVTRAPPPAPLRVQDSLSHEMTPTKSSAKFGPMTPSARRLERDLASPRPMTPRFPAQLSPPALGGESHRQSPFAKPMASPSHHQPSPSLPPPSANAFRVGHKKAASLVSAPNGYGLGPGRDVTSAGVLKSAGMPPTPMTGTFGPGQGRAGEHPIRQPRGPPPLEELVAAPTSRHDGSRNFATRQRRRAVHSLVRAGIERRTGRGSTGNTSPVSEVDPAFSLPSDTESDPRGSAAQSRKPSLGSLRAVANGAIGSERKGRASPFREREREHECGDGLYTAASLSSDEGVSIGGPLVEVKADGSNEATHVDRRQTPTLILTAAAKRKCSMF